MEVILLDRVKNLGKLGDQVKVRAGYGRNFLIPNGKAVMATPDNKAKFEARRQELEAAAAAAQAAAQVRADKLNGMTVQIACRAGDEGRLFGSIGTADVAKALADAAGIDVCKSEVRMPEGAIRSIGEYELDVQLHADVTTAVKVNVVPE